MTTGQKKLNAMNVHLLSSKISEYTGNKQAFRDTSMAFLKQLSEDVDLLLSEVLKARLIETRFIFNPSSPAAAGDPSLHFMTNMGAGITVWIRKGFRSDSQNSQKIMYHAIRHMRDYSGSGRNRWLSVLEPYESIVETIAKAAYRAAQE